MNFISCIELHVDRSACYSHQPSCHIYTYMYLYMYTTCTSQVQYPTCTCTCTCTFVVHVHGGCIHCTCISMYMYMYVYSGKHFRNAYYIVHTQLESLKDSLRTAERAVIQNVYQPKQALYRKAPILKGRASICCINNILQQQTFCPLLYLYMYMYNVMWYNK